MVRKFARKGMRDQETKSAPEKKYILAVWYLNLIPAPSAHPPSGASGAALLLESRAGRRGAAPACVMNASARQVGVDTGGRWAQAPDRHSSHRGQGALASPAAGHSRIPAVDVGCDVN